MHVRWTVALAVLLGSSSLAEDSPPQPDEGAERRTSSPGEANEGTSNRDAPDVDEALLRKLLGDALEGGGESLENPLDRAAERMEQAGQRLGDGRDTGEETRELQRGAISDLEKLIELARERGRQRSSSSPSNVPRDDPDRGDAQDETGATAGDGPAGTPGARRPDDDADESSETTREAREREVRLAEQRRLVKDVWGHLPPAMRDELLNAYADKPLPQYEALVRAYFRALAEKSTERD